MKTESINKLPWALLTLGVALIFTAASCRRESDSQTGPPGVGKGDTPMKFNLDSEAFAANAAMPKKYTGDGEDVSPALSWSDLPAGTKELALIMDDPDAPTAEPWVHWVIYKIPAETPDLQEEIAPSPQVADPAGALQGLNSWQTIGYRGPAPPAGPVHHYYFKLYALDTPLNVKPGIDKAALLTAMKGHVLGEAQLVGTYQR